MISNDPHFLIFEDFKKLSNLQWVQSTVKDVHSWLIGTSVLGHIFVWKVTDEKIDLVSILFFEDLSEAILSACSYKPDHLCCVYTSGEVVSWNLFTGEIKGINSKFIKFFIFEFLSIFYRSFNSSYHPAKKGLGLHCVGHRNGRCSWRTVRNIHLRRS